MTHTDPLPAYSDQELSGLTPAALIERMIGDEDRVPRNLIEACARRGDEMAERLQALLLGAAPWLEEEGSGEWWLRLHAAMILGRMTGERAGLLLAELMCRISLEEDDVLEEWLSGNWPALFANKPDAVLSRLRTLSEDRDADWFVRSDAMEAVLAAADREGGPALEAALDWLAGIAAREDEAWNVRLSAGYDLLDFPRPRHRALLDDLASRQGGWDAYFLPDDVSRAFSGIQRAKQWERFADPWEFYDPKVIADRQARWAEEAAEEAERQRRLAEDYEYAGDIEPYVREAPKVGRNDPCPCGSGKKYKKCCLPKEG